MKLPVDQRKLHSDFFLQAYPDKCPVLLNIEHAGKSVALKTCKCLIALDLPVSHQF
jgi:hypothetical protein